jgi:TonB-linked SusC/RagA family outer membrane protein
MTLNFTATKTLFSLRQISDCFFQKLFYVLLFSLIAGSATAQTVVSGTVRDNKGESIGQATVQVKGSSITTSTDGRGRYTLHLPNRNATLIISSVGFKPQEVNIKGRTTVDVTLEEDVAKLGEVVVVGYGKQSRDRLTTAISKLDTRALENIPYSNVLSALEGNIPGLRVQSYNGQPGLAPRVIVRGGTSINNPDGAAPLYIVDGVIKPDINDIAADDIESIQVLKDAASTAIYGARASNGVILVTTKSAKIGKTQITYSYDMTTANQDLGLDYVSAREYIQYARQAVIWTGVKLPASTTTARLNNPTGYGTGNDLTNRTAFTTQYLTPDNAYKLQEGWDSMPDPADPTKTIIFKETDFQKLSFRTAHSYNHYLSVAGGTEKVRFIGGVGYLKGEGTALNSDYNRLSVNFNSSVQISPKLTATGRLLYANTDYHFINADPQTQFSVMGNTFYRSPSLPSTAKFMFEDGTIAPGQGASIGNPYYYQIGPYAPQAKNNAQKLTIALSGKWDILPGLSFEPQVSSYEEEGFGRRFQPAYLTTVTSFNTVRSATQSYSDARYYQADAVLTYVKSIADNNFELKGGYSYYDRKTYSVSATGEGASTDLIPTLNASSIPRSVSGSEGRFITEGVFFRATYDYQGKYLANISGRYDGSSNLGADNQFGFFPAIGLGWNLHKEKFWQSVPHQISSFKLRGTYGVNGNIQGLSEFGWQGVYSVGSEYNAAGAILPSSIPNPDLRWEESKTLDFGSDIGFLNDRISLIIDVYRRVTDNLITNVALPTSSGYSTVQTNFGSLENRGVEMELNTRVLSPKSKLQWSMNFNAAKVESKVLKLPDNGIEGNRQGGVLIWDPATNSYVWRAGYGATGVFNNPSSFIEGSPIGDMYAYLQLGVYATDAEAANAPVDLSVPVDQVNRANGRKKYGGDVNFADRDGNDTIDSRDQVYMGNIFPKWTGGFSNYFTFKNFTLAIRTDFTLGHTIWNYAKIVADGQLQGDAMPTKDFIDKSWKKQGDITNTPRYLYQNSQGNITKSSVYYEKGDFLCLREVTIGYNLPSNLLSRIHVSNLRVNLTGSNLHYFTKYTGSNPEVGGSDNGRYPNPRSYTLGINVSL